MPKNNETAQARDYVSFETKEVEMDHFFEMPNPGVRAYFGRVRTGQPEVYRTSFYDSSSSKEVIDDWLDYLSNHLTDWPSLVEFEKDLASKVGPLSVMKPLQERLVDIDHYYRDTLSHPQPIFPAALSAVSAEWKAVRGIRPRSQSRTVEAMKLSTNSGNPFFTKRRSVVDKTLPIGIRNSDLYGSQTLGSKGTEWPTTAILGWRGQEGGPEPSDVKQRVVWMFPFALNVAELTVYQPLIEVGQRINWCPAWVSLDSVDERITQLFDTKDPKDLIVCTDFSKFDQHFNVEMQKGAEEILRSLLSDDAASRSWLRVTFPLKYTIPLMYDEGKIAVGPHGMASGSGGTNVDETLAHRALQFEAAMSRQTRLNINSQCLGDDGILSYPGITVEDVVKTYSTHGQEMNASKQYASRDECIYLRRWHHKAYRMRGRCVGVYSTCRALGKLMYRERKFSTWSDEMAVLRQLSIIENCNYHPLREQFADYCMKGDSRRLGLGIPGFFDNLDKHVKEATDHIPDFLGYTRSLNDDASGINNWWIVNYVKSRA